MPSDATSKQCLGVEKSPVIHLVWKINATRLWHLMLCAGTPGATHTARAAAHWDLSKDPPPLCPYVVPQIRDSKADLCCLILIYLAKDFTAKGIQQQHRWEKDKAISPANAECRCMHICLVCIHLTISQCIQVSVFASAVTFSNCSRELGKI